ncbi:MAG: trehalase family glycosidase [Terracidiphilus sp.]|nr:trehalase family glycosidase [Terracidiphilus sp.]MDR3777439.1 trehalase family glycosidase [Terracidiphilus sp.]
MPATASHVNSVLAPESFHHYVTEFQAQEQMVRQHAQEASAQNSDDPWQWMLANVPWFESSDANFQQIYYFRWFAFQKHIVHTDRGDLLNEFLYKVKWAGYGNTVSDAVPHHLREARWLRNPKLANDYTRFWFSSDAPHNRDYSVALAATVQDVTLATGNTSLGTDLLPAMVDNYHAWEATHQDRNGLFWSIDTRDGMEISISGDGYRPTLNSYMYGDARAIEQFAALRGDHALSAEFAAKAVEQKKRVETQLWNPHDQFYEVLSPAADSGIRKHPKFKDLGTTLAISNVRELIGYIPWYFNIPSPQHVGAWKQIADPHGFAGSFGPPTAERRSPRFRYANPDQCQWNGPMWGFATTQTLVAMANMMNSQQQNAVTRQDYLNLFAGYVNSHHMRLPDGTVVPWLDEAVDPDTGQWVTRQLLIDRKNPLQGRGAYYNHSGFVDPLITGLIGLRPREDNVIDLNPLLPAGAWSYFALDGLPYHGHSLSIVYDSTGRRYHRGAGLTLLVDGKKVASRKDLGPLHYTLPQK